MKKYPHRNRVRPFYILLLRTVRRNKHMWLSTNRVQKKFVVGNISHSKKDFFYIQYHLRI